MFHDLEARFDNISIFALTLVRRPVLSGVGHVDTGSRPSNTPRLKKTGGLAV
jgi:hypothetical protein